MGCPVEETVTIDGGMACGGNCSSSASYLVDGKSPDLNTSSPNWASQLVTVRKNGRDDGRIDYPHVLLSFIFEKPVSLSLIELDLFHCLEWNIGAPYLDVYSTNNTTSALNILNSPRGSSRTPQSSCDSLQTVQVSITNMAFHHTWFIVVSFAGEPALDWVHIGEVRFTELYEANNRFSMCNLTTPNSLSISSTAVHLSTPNPSPSFTLSTTGPPLPRPDTSGTTTQLSVRERPYVSSTDKIPVTSLPPVVGVPSAASPVPLNLIFIAGGGGVAFFLVVLLIILCCAMARRRSKAHHSKTVIDDFQSMPLPPTPSDPPTTNGHPVSSTNALLLSSDSSTFPPSYDRQSGLYEHIPAEQMLPLCKEGQIPSSTDPPAQPESATAACSFTSTGLLDAASTDPLVPSTTDRETLEPQDTYIDMKSHYHAASADIEQVLYRRIFVNEGIYSECITPSDFAAAGTQAQVLDSSGDYEFLAPVYPTLSTLPEGFRTIIEVSGDNINEIGELRVGQFGKIIQAKTMNLSLKSIGFSKTDDNRDISLLVAVKKLCPRPSQFHMDQEAFNRETKFLSQLKHPNILRFLGVCYLNPVFIMMEYLEEGDLNRFLQKYSEIVPIITPSTKTQITTSTLVYIAFQIANAMRYLANLNFIHRDLATRNCYIGANTVVKVGDLGVDMNCYKTHYYPIHGKTLLPIRWMATECFSGKFSEKSDVWAFGVTMWELFTLAKDLPYPHLSNEEVVQNSLQGESRQLLSKPVACTEPVFEIIERCWVHNMKQRATFFELHKLLQMHV